MADSELLLSCGKDAKILCSNPNTGEVSYAHHLIILCSEVAQWHMESGCSYACLSRNDAFVGFLPVLCLVYVPSGHIALLLGGKVPAHYKG